MTLRCGIIGAGQIAWRYDGGRWNGGLSVTHASCFDRHPKTELVALYDPIPESRANFIGNYAGADQVQVCDTLEAFFAQDLDLVSIASPSGLHPDHIHACMDAAIPLLWIEKPVSLSLTEFRNIEQKLATLPQQPRICVNYFRRALPQVAMMKSHVASSPGGLTCDITYSRKLAVNGVHLLDLLGHIFAAQRAPELNWQEADDENPDFGLTLEGVPVRVHGHDLPYHLIELVLTDTRGRLSLTGGGNALTWEAAIPNPDYPGFFMLAPPEPACLPEDCQAAMRDGMYLMLDNLVSDQGPSVSPLSEAFFSQHLMERVIGQENKI